KVGELMERQEQLTERHSRLAPLAKRAKGGAAEKPIPVPSPRPDSHARLQVEELGLDDIVTASAFSAVSGPSAAPWPLRAAKSDVDPVFVAIDRSLQDIETEQLQRVESLSEDAYQAAETIAEALASAGIPIASDYGIRDAGGPLITET